MGEFALFRIDDRLIHGQVMAVWSKALGSVDRIIVVDDQTAADEFMSQVMTMAAPPGMSVSVLTVDAAVPVLKDPALPRERTIVLMRSPHTARRLQEAGVPFKVLNIGGIGSRPGRKPIYRNISVSPEELQVLRQIEANGAEVVFRIVPEDRGAKLSSLAQGV